LLSNGGCILIGRLLAGSVFVPVSECYAFQRLCGRLWRPQAVLRRPQAEEKVLGGNERETKLCRLAVSPNFYYRVSQTRIIVLEVTVVNLYHYFAHFQR
jgi:hypothetical protein